MFCLLGMSYPGNISLYILRKAGTRFSNLHDTV